MLLEQQESSDDTDKESKDELVAYVYFEVFVTMLLCFMIGFASRNLIIIRKHFPTVVSYQIIGLIITSNVFCLIGHACINFTEPGGKTPLIIETICIYMTNI